MRICPIRIWSGLIPIHFQRWFRSGLNWIAQLRFAHEDQKGHGIHARVDYQQWARFSGATHCVPRVCLTREAIWWLAEVKIWRGCHGSCVEVWPLEVTVHVWIQFCTMQCGRDRLLWCALDSHWIRIRQFGYWTGLNPDSVWTGL